MCWRRTTGTVGWLPAWGAGLGILVGLFLPPVGLAVLVGGAAGAMVGAFAEHELRSGLQREIGGALDVGRGSGDCAGLPERSRTGRVNAVSGVGDQVCSDGSFDHQQPG